MPSVELKEFKIHYEIYGTGSETVILIPGALGTGITDFKPQLEGENALDLKRFRFIAVELPGWGHSRPPKRPYGLDVYDNDAQAVIKVMQVIFEYFLHIFEFLINKICSRNYNSTTVP